MTNVRCSSVKLGEFSSERSISILANLLQCCRFGLSYDADLVSEGDELFDVNKESMSRYRCCVEVSCRESKGQSGPDLGLTLLSLAHGKRSVISI